MKYTIRTNNDPTSSHHVLVSRDDEIVAIMPTVEQATEWVAKEVKRRAFCLRNWEIDAWSREP